MLSEQERIKYVNLVHTFVQAKTIKEYGLADRIRAELSQWQGSTSDERFMDMVRTGNFQWLDILDCRKDKKPAT
jgi:hypothetical protein